MNPINDLTPEPDKRPNQQAATEETRNRQQAVHDNVTSEWPSIQEMDRRVPSLPHEPSDDAWA